MGATFLKCEEIALDEDEAKLLGEAVTEVTAMYEPLAWMNEKNAALLNLTMVAATIYGPKISAIMLKGRNKRKPDAAKVTVMPPNAAPFEHRG